MAGYEAGTCSFMICCLVYIPVLLVCKVDVCVCVQNGNPQNPYCAGIAGVMDAYHRTLQAVQLYGPTNFSPVINHVARQVSCHSGIKLPMNLCEICTFSACSPVVKVMEYSKTIFQAWNVWKMIVKSWNFYNYLHRLLTITNKATQTHCYNPVVPAYPTWAYYAHGR